MQVKRAIWPLMLLLALVAALACQRIYSGAAVWSGGAAQGEKVRAKPFPADAPAVVKQVVEAAIEQTSYTTGYDPSYVKIDYPNGDVPLETGVCTDVIIRAFRKGGVDLQKEVHEDMQSNFAAYPTQWGLTKTDANIDHRRVPNLMTYFERRGKSLPLTTKGEDYRPGDLVTWDLGNKAPHIGMVTNLWSEETGQFLIVHNIGGGVRTEDVLFNWRVTGHYRYFK